MTKSRNLRAWCWLASLLDTSCSGGGDSSNPATGGSAGTGGGISGPPAQAEINMQIHATPNVPTGKLCIVGAHISVLGIPPPDETAPGGRVV